VNARPNLFDAAVEDNCKNQVQVWNVCRALLNGWNPGMYVGGRPYPVLLTGLTIPGVVIQGYFKR
jgi:hypothetical protein